MMTLWNACDRYLDQARELVGRVSAVQYSAPHAHCYGGSIGGHIRHCIEHFEGFRRGLESGSIDYDDRDRGTPEESDPSAALETLDDLVAWFRENSGTFCNSDPLLIKIDCGGDCEPDWEASTVGRELQFLASHTVHHFAIVGIMCEAQSIPVAVEFGVAPSTLKHEIRTGAAG